MCTDEKLVSTGQLWETCAQVADDDARCRTHGDVERASPLSAAMRTSTGINYEPRRLDWSTERITSKPGRADTIAPTRIGTNTTAVADDAGAATVRCLPLAAMQPGARAALRPPRR